MKTALREKARIVFMGAAILIIFSLYAHVQEETPDIVDLPYVQETLKTGNPKMESLLQRLIGVYEDEGIEGAKTFAAFRKIDIEGELVRVVIEAETQGLDDVGLQATTVFLKSQIENMGGKIEAVHEQLIQSYIPFNSAPILAGLPMIRYMRFPIKPKPLVTSQGVEKTGAFRWHSLQAYRSESAKVCILDLGFKGYEGLLGNELPTSVVTRSFRSDKDLSGGTVHGAACGEIVNDMAPDAKLWLVNFETFVELANAVDWLIDQGVEIISASFGSNYFPEDGTGPGCEDVKKAHNNGITWVNAAGNEAEDHWAGTFSDPDHDNWHNFSGADEVLSFDLPAYVPVDVFLRWNDWGNWNGSYYSGSAQDYDLYLYFFDGTNWLYVDKSENNQTGSQNPVEGIDGWYSRRAAKWGIAIMRYSASRAVKFDAFIFTHAGNIEYNVPEGSLGSPGDSPFAVTVGAVDWSDDAYHGYSSQGPTADGRIKPDICAPSGVATASYGDPFYGTSAACPHVAGAFALVKGKTPYSLTQIRQILESRAIDLGNPGKDNKFGVGRLSLIKESAGTRRGEGSTGAQSKKTETLPK